MCDAIVPAGSSYGMPMNASSLRIATALPNSGSTSPSRLGLTSSSLGPAPPCWRLKHFLRDKVVESSFGPMADDSEGSAAELADLNVLERRLAVDGYCRGRALRITSTSNATFRGTVCVPVARR
jgi:hypothetical protein